MVNYFEQIKRADSTGKVLFGTKESEKAILTGTAKYIFYSSDLEAMTKERVEYLVKLGKIKAKELPLGYTELGEAVGKEYSVGILVVLDAGKAKFDIK